MSKHESETLMDAKKIAKILLFICIVLTVGIVGIIKVLDLEPKSLIGRD